MQLLNTVGRYPEPAEVKAARDKAWRAANKEKVAEQGRRRRERKREAGGVLTAAEWRKMLVDCSNRCLCCGKYDEHLEADHVVPLSLGGTNNASNRQPLCKSCNAAKAMQIVDYRTT